jgi:F-type H+-transporting ATPase subunit b
VLEINLPILIVQAVTFLIAVFILWKAAWGPLTRMMEARRKGIEGDIEKAAQNVRDSERLRLDYEQRLAKIDAEIDLILDKASSDGHSRRDQILREAEEEAKRLIENVRNEIKMEKQSALQEMRRETVNLAVLIAEKILKQSVDPKAQDALLKEFIGGLKNG